MRILLLTPRFPVPPIGGDKLRIVHIARFLASRGHTLTLLSLADGDCPGDIDTGVFQRVVTSSHTRANRYLNAACGLLSDRPLQVAYFRSREFQRLVSAEVNDGGHDAVLCHFVRTAQFVRRRERIPRVCEMTDAFSKYYGDVIRQRKGGLRNLLYRAVEFRRMRRYEREIVREFDRCVVVSKADKDYITGGESAVQRKLEVIPNGVDYERFRFYDGPYDDRLIVFIGNMRTSRNCDACVHFAERILPIVRREMPDVRFRIIGAEPRREVRRLAGRGGVEVTGRVDDVQSEAGKAAVSVCPVRLAVGVQNKVLESMAMGVPVVSSPMGVQGLEVEAGRDILVGDAPKDFARHVLKVLRSRHLRQDLAMAARKRVEQDYSWDGRLADYERIFQELT